MEQEIIKSLQKTQNELIFKKFDETDAFEIGSKIREIGLLNNHPISIKISVNRRTLFYASLKNATPLNESMVLRKENVVYRFFKSSYEMALYMVLKNDNIYNRYGVDRENFDAVGGSLPLVIDGLGVVGAITVSGLSPEDDHNLIVSVLKEHFKK